MTELTDLLATWLPAQRWFGGKGRAIAAVAAESSGILHQTETSVVRHLLLRVESEDGGTDRYQLLVGELSGEVPQRLQHAVIGEADGRTVYDAVHDADATAALLSRIAAGEQTDTVRFTAASDALDTDKPSRVMDAEQSNTSVVYGEDYILKVFRRVQPGLNPDLEITRALADAGSSHVAPPLAWLEGDVDGEPTTLGMMQCFLRGASEGWAMATASVRDLFAEGDLHADEVGGDFAGESERLGAATAEVHALMAQTLPSRTAGPEDSRATAAQLHERLDAALAIVAELAPYADALRTTYDQVSALTDDIPVQRVHGDFHLGQVLRTQDRWVVLDFEGEPARSLAERTALMSPLRDVAGMLRSFDYAARHLLADHPGEQHLAYRATEWAERNRSAFCDGYSAAAGADPRDSAILLRAFELDKAVYEVVYEARNRPSWLPIPLGSIERLAAEVTT
ncbi:MAG: aminoglycoside phosphotransferase [Actinobacteria bacterium]|nr:aminoglycoside phosphotransferase [Actinomycetota bacterium]MCA1720464.1 aminoglycoside phosphotransferase [Actinomycetota bacterium]